jgi:hypothetical protein
MKDISDCSISERDFSKGTNKQSEMDFVNNGLAKESVYICFQAVLMYISCIFFG